MSRLTAGVVGVCNRITGMGYENREYMRPETAGWYSRGDTLTVTFYLIAVTTAVFFLQAFVKPGGVPVVENFLRLSTESLQNGYVWQVVTYAFCHATADLLHLLINMFMLFMFGRVLEARLGRSEFLRFYVLSAAFAGLVCIGSAIGMGNHLQLIGASGAVLAVITLTAIYYPRMELMLMGIIPIELWMLAVFLVVIDAIPAVAQLFGQAPTDAVAHMAHLGGVAFAALYYRLNWRLDTWTLPRVAQLRRPKVRPSVRLYETPKSTYDEDELDRILGKIHLEGEASLTPKERSFMIEASRQLRERV